MTELKKDELTKITGGNNGAEEEEKPNIIIDNSIKTEKVAPVELKLNPLVEEVLNKINEK